MDVLRVNYEKLSGTRKGEPPRAIRARRLNTEQRSSLFIAIQPSKRRTHDRFTKWYRDRQGKDKLIALRLLIATVVLRKHFQIRSQGSGCLASLPCSYS